jgi:hypothetical protein
MERGDADPWSVSARHAIAASESRVRERATLHSYLTVRGD